jgi:fibronectin-binding autotransporter adhesin
MSRVSEHRSFFQRVWKASRCKARLQGRPRSRTIRLSLDTLEDRVTPSTFLVTNASDPQHRLVSGSLRRAINQANLPRNQGSTVEITAAVKGPITLHAGELPIRSSVTIENASGIPLTIQQATSNSRIFHVVATRQTTAVTITGLNAASTLTLTGGQVVNDNGGGILVDNPGNALTLSYVNVVGNSAIQTNSPPPSKHRQSSGDGGGIHGNGGGIYSRGTVTLDHSSVTSNSAIGINSASGQAGGVYTDQGVILNASHVDANVALDAAGILNVTGPIQVLNGSTVNGNSSSGDAFAVGELGGGGIGQMAGNVFISDSQVSNNKAVGMYSGGIVILVGGVTVTNGSHVDGNSDDGPGGGIAANFGGPVVVSHGSTVNGNTCAGLGGGVVNFSETYGISVTDNSQVNNNTLTNGEVAALNGLLEVGAGFLTAGRGDPLLLSALQQFAAVIAQRAGAILGASAQLPSAGNTQVGGGIASALTGPIDISGGSEVIGNRFAGVVTNLPAVGFGGGVFANLGTITIDGSTVSDNVATGSGGGIWNGASLTIRNSTVTRNHAAASGGGIFNRGVFTSSNTLIANNTPDDLFPPA